MTEKKKNNKSSLIVIILAVLAIIAAAVYFLVLKSPVVTFKDGNSVYFKTEVKKGEVISNWPADPKKEGYDFKGWYFNGAVYDKQSPVTKNIELQANWKEEQFVSFYVNNEAYAKVKIVDGYVDTPKNPEAEKGYAFAGWEDGGKIVDFSQQFEDGFVVNAVFKPFVQITSMKFEKDTYYVEVDKDFFLYPDIKPDDWQESLTFTSSDESVLKVSESGMAHGYKPGTVKVTVVSESGAKAETTVIVDTYPTDISLASEMDLEHGKTAKLDVKFTPEDVTNKSLTYSSSDSKIVTVDKNGNLKAVGYGTATITVKTANNISKKIKVYANGRYYSLGFYDTNSQPISGDVYLYYSPNNEKKFYVTISRVWYSRGEKGSSPGYPTKIKPSYTNRLCVDGLGDMSDYAEVYAYENCNFNSMKKPYSEKVYFEYTDDETGITYKSAEITIHYEVQLEVSIPEETGTITGNQVVLKGNTGDTVYFRLTVYTKDTVETHSSNITLQKTGTGMDKDPNKPNLYHFTFFMKKGETGTIKFTTPAGQKLTLTVK